MFYLGEEGSKQGGYGMSIKSKAEKLPKQQTLMKRNVKDNIEYYVMMAPVLILMFIFSYYPMQGIALAFQDFKPGAPFISLSNKWVGLKHFEKFLGGYYVKRLLWNSFRLNLLDLLMAFWVPIAFALLLNELKFTKLRKIIQTVSYMPHFISMVVIAAMFLEFISERGFITLFLQWLGFDAKALSMNKGFMPWYYTFVMSWKGFGWGSILYLANIASVDPGLYEAAELDGAGRWRKMWHVTLPGIRQLIIIQTIFAIGSLFDGSTEAILLFYNGATMETMDIIGTFVFRDGLMGGNYSYGTAVSLFMAAIGFILTLTTNKLADKFANYSLW